MAKAANAFLATLSEDQKMIAVRAFDDPARLDWHNIPKPERKGLQFRDMTGETRLKARELLRSGLSEQGYAQALRIMALEENLRIGEQGIANPQLRDPERYFLTIFGRPDNTDTWGWSWEGHHLSLNFVIRHGQVIASTPGFWGANPATVRRDAGPDGVPPGTRTLGNEEEAVLALIASLDPARLEKARIASSPPAEYRAAGSPQPPSDPPQGLAASDMSMAQRERLVGLLGVYASHWAPDIAARVTRDIESADWGRVHLGWAGSTVPGQGRYCRVQGPTVLLEFINVQSDPYGGTANHIHSVWRDPRGDFAQPTPAPGLPAAPPGLPAAPPGLPAAPPGLPAAPPEAGDKTK